ncbi:MAG: glycoside hydrolase family 9 protein [Fimbriimonadales bacterium]|nr:glycoside hydrolase family 9 protein [Fimbriimonadales bacterium]
MDWRLTERQTLEAPGLIVALCHDHYPEGHQHGLTLIQNGRRIAANGMLLLEPTPGQWSPSPKVGTRQADPARLELSVPAEYPDPSRDRAGFNPVEYPDLRLGATVAVRADGDGLLLTVRLDREPPAQWRDRVGFALELFPGELFGRTFLADSGEGVFPRQATGVCSGPLASGRELHVAPEDPERRLRFESLQGGELQLWDARHRHNNAWFVVWAAMQGTSLAWRIRPHAVPGWKSEPVVLASQVGYRPQDSVPVAIELDPADQPPSSAVLLRVEPAGLVPRAALEAKEWGRFLRFRYLQTELPRNVPRGLYVLRCAGRDSSPFRIAEDAYEGLWRPTLDTFLPVQMCHMRVEENYRVWHGACHLDDARMAPLNHNHFDGYVQGPEPLCPHNPGERIEGLNEGGWHDAGDYDLRVESQSHTVLGLALAWEEFGIDEDDTTVDFERRLVLLRQPDGVPDILQQIEHGTRFLVAAWRAVGRCFRGIIEPTLKQYVHLGDGATQTDNLPSDDDRWVFTQDLRVRQVDWAAALAAASRALRGVNPALAQEALRAAEDLYADGGERSGEAAWELYRATGDAAHLRAAQSRLPEDARLDPSRHADALARAAAKMEDAAFSRAAREALEPHARELEAMRRETPFGVPYRPQIWGAAWGVQRLGVRQYWIHRAFPDLAPREAFVAALQFVLGCHPGPNPASFVSGVGARSVIPGYGVNRADGGYIAGGIASGTNLVRPDLPELLEWPYLWQQTEYCLGWPTSDFVFLAAAAARG